MAAVSGKRVQDPKNILLAQDVAKTAFDARDEKSVRKLLRHARIQHFEPKVINLLVGAMRRYTMEILGDARDFADHAGREEIEIDDTRLAVRKKQESLGATLPSREDMIALAEEVNSKPLPPIPDVFGIRLPPPRYQTTLPNVQWEVEHVVPEKETEPKAVNMDIDVGHGDRNKKSSNEPRLTSKRPLMLKEKKTQEEEQRERDAKRARRRMLAQQAGRT